MPSLEEIAATIWEAGAETAEFLPVKGLICFSVSGHELRAHPSEAVARLQDYARAKLEGADMPRLQHALHEAWEELRESFKAAFKSGLLRMFAREESSLLHRFIEVPSDILPQVLRFDWTDGTAGLPGRRTLYSVHLAWNDEQQQRNAEQQLPWLREHTRTLIRRAFGVNVPRPASMSRKSFCNTVRAQALLGEAIPSDDTILRTAGWRR
jgi:hypothetical protein